MLLVKEGINKTVCEDSTWGMCLMVSAASVGRNKQKTVCEDSAWGVCLMVSAASVGRNKQKFVRTVLGACV